MMRDGQKKKKREKNKKESVETERDNKKFNYL